MLCDFECTMVLVTSFFPDETGEASGRGDGAKGTGVARLGINIKDIEALFFKDYSGYIIYLVLLDGSRKIGVLYNPIRRRRAMVTDLGGTTMRFRTWARRGEVCLVAWERKRRTTSMAREKGSRQWGR